MGTQQKYTGHIVRVDAKEVGLPGVHIVLALDSGGRKPFSIVGMELSAVGEREHLRITMGDEGVVTVERLNMFDSSLSVIVFDTRPDTTRCPICGEPTAGKPVCGVFFCKEHRPLAVEVRDQSQKEPRLHEWLKTPAGFKTLVQTCLDELENQLAARRRMTDALGDVLFAQVV